MSEKILLVEDNEDFAEVLRLHLEKRDFEVTHVTDGEEGLTLALSKSYALLILDIALPTRDGLSILAEVRKVDSKTPILMLTSRTEEIDKVVGFEMGADEYVTKPFSVAELMARISALLRRAGINWTDVKMAEGELLSFGSLQIDVGKRKVIRDGQELEMTSKEFDLLSFLATHAGQAFSRDDLIEKVWEFGGGDYSGTVNTIIMRIRKKIEDDPANPSLVETVRGYGYRFTDRKDW